jgi:hypothetical protein
MRTAIARSANLGALAALVCALSVVRADTTQAGATTYGYTWGVVHRYIVQSSSAAWARQDVMRIGGVVRQDLPIIHGVAADLSNSQAEKLRALRNVRVFEDRPVGTRGAPKPAPSSVSTVLTDGTALAAKANQYTTNFPRSGAEERHYGEGHHHRRARYGNLDRRRR